MHLHYLFRCFFAPTFFDEPRVPRFPKTKSAFEFASPRDLLSRRLTRSGNGVARARLRQMVRQARPAPHNRLRRRCRAHQRARACRILHVGDRWPHARAERRWQLVEHHEPPVFLLAVVPDPPQHGIPRRARLGSRAATRPHVRASAPRICTPDISSEPPPPRTLSSSAAEPQRWDPARTSNGCDLLQRGGKGELVAWTTG